MATLTISTTPSKIPWADDDDDFDLDTWKSTADLSCPSTLPPLQLPKPDPEPLYTSFLSPSGESAQLAPSSSSPSTSIAVPLKIDWSTTDPRCAAPLLAWRAVEKVPEKPAYKEMGDYWGRRVGYAQNWAWVKAGSGWDCGGAVLYRGSGLKVVKEVEEDEEEKEVGLGVIVEEDEDEEMVEEEEEEEKAIEAAGSYAIEVVVVEEEKVITAAVGVVVIEEEKTIDAAEVDIVEIFEVAEKPDLTIPPMDLALPSKPELKILPVDIALPSKPSPEILPADLAPITPPVELEISFIEAIDLAPSTTIPLPPSDIDTSPAFPIKSIQYEGYFTDTSLSPPLSPTITSIGLAPAAVFAKPAHKHQRRDSQQMLDDDNTSSGASSDVMGDIEYVGLEYCVPIVSLEDTEGSQGAATFGSKDAALAPIFAQESGTSTTGWYNALNMSCTTFALITAGVLAGGAMCFGRRRP